MRGIGVHVCERCGAVYDTIGAYWDCVESHDEPTGPDLVRVVPVVGDGVIHGALSESVGDYTYLPSREVGTDD